MVVFLASRLDWSLMKFTKNDNPIFGWSFISTDELFIYSVNNATKRIKYNATYCDKKSKSTSRRSTPLSPQRVLQKIPLMTTEAMTPSILYNICMRSSSIMFNNKTVSCTQTRTITIKTSIDNY